MFFDPWNLFFGHCRMLRPLMARFTLHPSISWTSRCRPSTMTGLPDGFCFIVKQSVHFVDFIWSPGTWSVRLVDFILYPSTSRRLYRPLYEFVKLFTFLGDPSTLWRLYRPLYELVKFFPVLGWSVHFVAAISSVLWTCKILPRFGVIRPLCGGYIVHFMDL